MTNVVVTVTGTQRDETGDEQCIKLITTGQYYCKNGTDYITYDESQLTGLEGTTTLLKIQKQQVVLVRMGAVEQRQEFRHGEQSFSTYITPYGTLKMSVITRELMINFDQGSGQIAITYELEIEGQWQSTNRLVITIREETRKDGH